MSTGAAGAGGATAAPCEAVRPWTSPGRRPRVEHWLWGRRHLVAVSLVALWDLWSLRATLLPVAYLYDASVHEEMVKFATNVIDHGHFPYTSWFPLIGFGSAQFLHYQSLPSVLTALAGTVVGPATAFRWSLYLLVALWPFAIYGSARLFGLPRGASAAAALLSPFVVSYTGIGFERGAYSWGGGAEVWTQLFGSWALPFAWAATWRAFRQARYIWLACALVGLTIALHFLCGYLALLAIMVFAFTARGGLAGRLARALTMLAGSLVAAAWVVVPLVLTSNWASIDEPLAGTPYVDGYGARQELAWLIKGQLFDARRAVPAISVAVFVGTVLALYKWRRDALARSFVVLFVATLLLSFGSTTWGALADLVPAHADLYFRRFTMGTQLAGIYLAGTAVAWAWGSARAWAKRASASRGLRATALACTAAALLAWFSPAAAEISSYDQQDAAVIQSQRQADASQGAQIAPLVSYVESHDYGRSYAGLAGNWGGTFMVGSVPVYKYLDRFGIDEMSYQVPTLSLMLDAESDFDQYDPADYSLFGVRYIFAPSGMNPPVAASLVIHRGEYALWQVGDNGYLEVVESTGSLREDRADITSRCLVLLDTLVPGVDWAVQYPGLAPPGRPESATPLGDAGLPPAGAVVASKVDLDAGLVTARVDMAKPGTLLLSETYDPGWHAWVDGRAVPTVMMAPALLGVPLATGAHEVVLRYEGPSWYPWLWLTGLVGLVLLAIAGRGWDRRAETEHGPAQAGPAPL